METKTIHILFTVGFLILLSCSGDHHKDDSVIVEESATGYVTLSPEQLEYTDIVTATIQKHVITDIIECNGSIEADPNQEATVSPHMKGYLKEINSHIGDFVRKGEVLALLEHPGYVNLQQEFLEVQSQYDYYKEDFKRQGELSLENAASIKKMQQAQNEFRKIEAQLFSLKKHLAFIGINSDSLTVENIQSSVRLITPISGYITEIDGFLGKLCLEEEPLFHIVGSNASLLHLNVYEKDAAKVHIGQEIKFSVISDANIIYNAKIKAVARAIDENKTVSIHAGILEKSKELLPGMFVKASILVNTDSVYALKDEAIVRKNDQQYIFIKIDSTTFEPILIETGRKYADLTEILRVNTKIKESEIVSSGAYYLFSEYIKEE